MKIRIYAGCVLGIGVLTATACEDVPTAPPATPRSPSELFAHASLARVVTADDQMEAIAADVPGFGGFYLDASGRLIVRLVDPSQRYAAASALQAVFADQRYFPALGEADVSRMIVVSAMYSFPQFASVAETAR